MDDEGLLQKIKDIVDAVPDELYKYKKPDDWDDNDWINSSSVEKGFILIRELIENKDIREYQERKAKPQNSNQINVLNLGKGPIFWSNNDESMFFNAFKSMASYVDIKGHGTSLDLYHQKVLSIEERNFLIALLKRYQMKIPKELYTLKRLYLYVEDRSRLFLIPTGDSYKIGIDEINFIFELNYPPSGSELSSTLLKSFDLCYSKESKGHVLKRRLQKEQTAKGELELILIEWDAREGYSMIPTWRKKGYEFYPILNEKRSLNDDFNNQELIKILEITLDIGIDYTKEYAIK